MLSFDPVLDRSAYNSKTEPRRRASHQAGLALQRIATDVGTLVAAVQAAQHPDAGSRLQQRFGGRIGKIDEDTSVQLVNQLRQVKAFAELDGGQVDARNLEGAWRLISGGRFELFAGHPAPSTARGSAGA